MRIGPLQTFAQAPESVILDDRYRKGVVQTDSTLTAFRLYPVPKHRACVVRRPADGSPDDLANPRLEERDHCLAAAYTR